MSHSIELVARAYRASQRIALIDRGSAYSYADLLAGSEAIASYLAKHVGRAPGHLREARIAYLIEPGFDHVATQWGIWRAGGVAVPLAMSHPAPELKRVLEDSGAAAVVVSGDLLDRVRAVAFELGLSCIRPEQAKQQVHEQLACEVPLEGRALMLYTSGTTGRPKGVVITHAQLQTQVETLVAAWQWSADDHIQHILPMHHIHGIVNVLMCALWSGARCEFASFDEQRTLRRIAAGDLTLFMAVPTIYQKLIQAFDRADPALQMGVRAGCRRMRLMVSGSASLPVSTMSRWREISGHDLLERYGMTEIGMALSNPYDGKRVPGHVGQPLPGMLVQRVDEHGNVVADDEPGEIEVRGPAVFHEYWQRPEETAASFRDGWFRTGDVAVVEDGSYRILGRTSVDIIKTGGFKVSALEIEEVLRQNPQIVDCAVVGVPDEEWGERVATCIVVAAAPPSLEELRGWAKQRLATYKVPSLLQVVAELPRNAMGKVTKAVVKELFTSACREATQ